MPWIMYVVYLEVVVHPSILTVDLIHVQVWKERLAEINGKNSDHHKNTLRKKIDKMCHLLSEY